MFDLSKAQKVYIAVGYSDLRRGIDGFATIIQNTFHMNPQSDALFLFLYWDGDGYILLYKRLESGKYQWPRTTEELKELTSQQFRWLMEGLSIYQKKAIHTVDKQLIF